MKQKKDLRRSNSFKEILNTLFKAQKSRQNFLWLPQNRELIPIFINYIKIDEEAIEIRLKKPSSTMFSVGDFMYLNLESGNSAIKTKIQSLTTSGIVLEFPDSIVLSELRVEPRTYFNSSDEKKIQLKRINSNSASQSHQPLVLNVADISLGGMALILNPTQSSILQAKDKILLEYIGPFPISPAIIGEIVFKSSGDANSKIGIQLEEKIPKSTFDQFCDVGTPSNNQFFRKKLGPRFEKLLNSMLSKNELKDIFQELDRSHKECPYLMQHIVFLAEVMCGLGTTLGWISESSLDKLIYVALMHDALLFNTPKLAKIKSIKEFNEIKDTLTLQEQNLFLTSPNYAASLAIKDNKSFPDTEKILLQQKELPDGSGFPNGIVGSQLTPLSCLFIVSHYYVDYSLSEKTASVSDFVKIHQKLLKGIHFQKIFQAMRG